jgi:hypothetical protein
VTRDRFDGDLEDEMQLHVDLRARQLLERGVGADEARRQAQARFGHPARHVERSRDAWGLRGLEAAVQDVHYAVRLLARHLDGGGFLAVQLVDGSRRQPRGRVEITLAAAYREGVRIVEKAELDAREVRNRDAGTDRWGRGRQRIRDARRRAGRRRDRRSQSDVGRRTELSRRAVELDEGERS